MTLDLAKLRKIASKATQGPWKVSRLIRWNVIADEEQTLISEPYCRENARHIATFAPPTILALLDRLEKAESVCKEASRWADVDYGEPGELDADASLLDAVKDWRAARAK